MAKTYQAGVKEYRETYWMPEYTPKDTDILACFKITPQRVFDRHLDHGVDGPVDRLGLLQGPRLRH